MNNTTDESAAQIAGRISQITTDNWNWMINHSTQIVIASVMGAVIFMALLGLKWFGKRLYSRNTQTSDWQTVIGKALSRTRMWFMVAAVAQVVANYAHAPNDLAVTVKFLFVIAATLQAAVFIRAIILGVIELRAQGHGEHAALASAMGIIRLLVTFVLFAIASILILSNLGVNVTGLIAGLGVGGIAIGLAAQGVFANLFAALTVLFDRPFGKGDAIKYDGTSGTVEDIGLMSTRIRALTGEQIIISNKQLLEKEIHNQARLNRRRIVSTFGVIYQVPPETLARIPDMIADVIEQCPPAKLVRCGMTTFGTSSLDFELQYDVHSENYDVVFATRHAVNIAILRLFAKEGIDFAYPTQTAFTAAPDGRMIMPYPEDSKPSPAPRTKRT